MFYRRDAEMQIFKFEAFKLTVSNYPGNNLLDRLRVSASLRLILLLALVAAGCSIPNLEPPACAGSRTAVREFYSFHFGNDMKFSPENLKQREKYLTPDFSQKIGSLQEGVDPFTTGTNDLPKAFRVGECKEVSPEETEFQVLLFWRDDTRSEQREIRVAAKRQNGKWLIDKVF